MNIIVAALTLAAAWAWAVAHQLIFGWLFAVAVDNLPAPQKPYGFYAWFFGVTQMLAANLKRGGMGIKATLGKGQQPTP